MTLCFLQLLYGAAWPINGSRPFEGLYIVDVRGQKVQAISTFYMHCFSLAAKLPIIPIFFICHDISNLVVVLP